MASRKLVVEVIGDSRSLEKAFKKSSNSASRFGRDLDKTGRKSRSVFGGLTKTIGLASGALGAIGLAGAAKAAFTEMLDAQKVTAQTNAVLKSTGGIANVTAKQIDKQAEALMRLSGVDDEAIKSGQNMLLTFTKIRNQAGKGNKIFDQATVAILNLSVAMKKDMASSAILVGKALNDPVKGVAALSKAGVQFDAAQKNRIKDLVEGRKAVDNFLSSNVDLTLSQLEQAKKMEKLGSGWEDIARTLKLKLNPAQKKLLDYWERGGHEMEAQKMILKELNTQFGESARAAGDTLSGKLNILRESLLNLGGAIAQKLAPELTKIVDKITDWLLKTENQEKVMKTVTDAAAVLGSVLKVLRKAMDRLNDITGSTANTLKLLAAVLVTIKTLQMVSALAGIARSIGLVGTSADAATKKVALLRKGLIGLTTIGAIVITLQLVIENKDQIDKWLRKLNLGGLAGGLFDLPGHLLRPGRVSGGSTPQRPAPPPPKLPARPPPRGTRSLQGATVVNVGTVVTQDPDKFVRDMQKKAARTRAQQRGVRPGVALGGA